MMIEGKDLKDLALAVWRLVEDNPNFECQDCFDALDDELKETIIWSKDILGFFNYCYSRAKIIEGIRKSYSYSIYLDNGWSKYIYHCFHFVNSIEAVKNK